MRKKNKKRRNESVSPSRETTEILNREAPEIKFMERTMWNGWGAIFSIIGIIVASFTLLIAYFTLKEAKYINEKMEKQMYKESAEKYFKDNRFQQAFDEYKKLKDIDSTDASGYYNFLDKAIAEDLAESEDSLFIKMLLKCAIELDFYASDTIFDKYKVERR